MSIVCGEYYSLEDLIRLTFVKPSGVVYIDCGEDFLSLEDILSLLIGQDDDFNEGINIITATQP